MICVLLAEGFEEIEALTVADVLRRAGCDVSTVGITGNSVTGAHGITVVSDAGPDKVEEIIRDNKIEMVVLPGGMPGTKNLDKSSLTDSFINLMINTDGYLAAICAAPSVLGKRGLLKSRKAACYPGFEKYLTGAETTDESVVVDGKIITSRGPGTAFKFSLELVRILKGDRIYDEIKSAALA